MFINNERILALARNAPWRLKRYGYRRVYVPIPSINSSENRPNPGNQPNSESQPPEIHPKPEEDHTEPANLETNHRPEKPKVDTYEKRTLAKLGKRLDKEAREEIAARQTEQTNKAPKGEPKDSKRQNFA